MRFHRLTSEQDREGARRRNGMEGKEGREGESERYFASAVAVAATTSEFEIRLSAVVLLLSFPASDREREKRRQCKRWRCCETCILMVAYVFARRSVCHTACDLSRETASGNFYSSVRLPSCCCCCPVIVSFDSMTAVAKPLHCVRFVSRQTCVCAIAAREREIAVCLGRRGRVV